MADETRHIDILEKLQEIQKSDPRYATEAYLFVFQGLDRTVTKLAEARHVSGRELLEGLRELAIEQFGLLAKTVLYRWGVRTTEDFGHIVFNLVNAGLMGKTDEDSIEDFRGGYTFEQAFERDVHLDVKIQ